MYDPPVHTHKTVLMQRLLNAAIRGHVWHTSGRVPITRAAHLADKFADLYHVDRNANQRAYAKRKGNANSRLFFLTRPEHDDLLWWLLVTNGNGLVHERETLHAITDRRHRLRIGDEYELVRVTRKSEHGGGLVWTWRMTRQCLEAWRTRIIQACRLGSSEFLQEALHSLYRTPGFSGIRRQVGTLATLARHEWRRRHGTDAPSFHCRLGYLERLEDRTLPLSAWCASRG